MLLLLTNDDGYESFLFRILINYLKKKNYQLMVVAPKFEQSWTSKSMTRWKDLTLEQIEIEGVPSYIIDGTPADCVNAGIYNLCAEKPDLVVSGINIGSNTGIGFILSSATVGASIEANIAGIPSFALSQVLAADVYKYYSANKTLPLDILNKLDGQICSYLDLIFATYAEKSITAQKKTTLNFNFPFDGSDQTKIHPVSISNSTYGGCFELQGNTLKRKIAGRILDEDERADVYYTQNGMATVSEFDYSKLV